MNCSQVNQFSTRSFQYTYNHTYSQTYNSKTKVRWLKMNGEQYQELLYLLLTKKEHLTGTKVGNWDKAYRWLVGKQVTDSVWMTKYMDDLSNITNYRLLPYAYSNLVTSHSEDFCAELLIDNLTRKWHYPLTCRIILHVTG
jgi:hypothetical protein